MSPLIGSSLTTRFIRFSFWFELSFRNQLALLSYFRGGPESSQIATNTREILFNGAGGQTLVYHSDVVNMHDTRYVFLFTAASEQSIVSSTSPMGRP